jgi:lysophospholipase L1-like esterase
MKAGARGKKLFPKLLLLLFGIIAGALIAEVALRVLGYSYPEFYQLDYSRGYALRPRMEGWYRKEGESYVRINSDGLRDREHSKNKPSDTIRIAVLGDSFPEALQVTEEQAFWAVMEKQLQDCGSFGGKKVEVLNFGVSGYGTAQELITLREQVWQYSPNIVLLAITTNNDITDNSLALKKTEEVPYFVYRDGALVLDDSFRTSRAFRLRQSFLNRFGRWFKDHSRLVQALNEKHHGLKILLGSWRDRLKKSPPPPAPAPTEPAAVVPNTEEPGIDNQIYLEPFNQAWSDAWSVTEGIVKEMAGEVKDQGASFVVVTLTNPPQIVPNENFRREFLKRIGAADIFYPDNRIKAFCEQAGIPVINLAPDIQKYADQQNAFLHGIGANIGNGHWNALGHRVAGELLAKKLCEQ